MSALKELFAEPVVKDGLIGDTLIVAEPDPKQDDNPEPTPPEPTA